MVKFVMTDAKVLYDGRDISGDLNTVGLEYTAELVDCTAFGDITRRRLAGLLDVNANHQGFWDHVGASDSLDKELFDKIGLAANGLMSMSDSGGTLGDVGFSFIGREGEYAPGASVGEILAFTITVVGDGPLTRGLVMENSVFTVTVNGTPRQNGAALSTDTIYSTVHVVAASGTTPTLDVTVESDDLIGFGTPLVRLTHPQFTTVGANQQTLVGPVTDDWWRLVMTISGGSPSFTVFGILAIQQTVP